MDNTKKKGIRERRVFRFLGIDKPIIPIDEKYRPRHARIEDLIKDVEETLGAMCARMNIGEEFLEYIRQEETLRIVSASKKIHLRKARIFNFTVPDTSVLATQKVAAQLCYAVMRK